MRSSLSTCIRRHRNRRNNFLKVRFTVLKLTFKILSLNLTALNLSLTQQNRRTLMTWSRKTGLIREEQEKKNIPASARKHPRFRPKTFKRIQHRPKTNNPLLHLYFYKLKRGFLLYSFPLLFVSPSSVKSSGSGRTHPLSSYRFIKHRNCGKA